MLSIRPLTRLDANHVQLLADESEADGFRFVARFLQALNTGALVLDDATQFYLGVFESERLVAIGGISPDPYVDNSGVGRVRHVYVAKSSRRTGVGRMLMSALETRAKLKFPILRLRTDTAAAAEFYEAIGYRKTTESNATHRRTWSAVKPKPASEPNLDDAFGLDG